MSSSQAEEFFNKIKELYSLYEKVKLCIIYAENFDPKHELYVAPMNQLRSSLDHIFKAAVHPNDIEYELKEAREHLDRAGYDAYEILASNLGHTIYDKLKSYPTYVLTTVFPEYFTEIKPHVIEIQANIGEIRKRKKDNSSPTGIDVSFSAYYDQVAMLMGFIKKIDSRIPSIEEFHQLKIREIALQEKKNQLIRQKEKWFNAIVVGVLSATISGIIVYYFTNLSKLTDKKIIKTELNATNPQKQATSAEKIIKP